MEKALKNLQLLKKYVNNLDSYDMESPVNSSLIQSFSQTDGDKILEEIRTLSTRILVIYGIGRGESYPILKKWLKKGSYLIYLEDDLEVLKAFLSESNAEEILKDPRVVVDYIGKQDEWGQNLMELIRGTLPLSLSHEPCYFTALSSYRKEKSKAFQHLQSQFYFIVDRVRSDLEYFDQSGLIEGNFLFNILQRLDSLFAKGLKNSFRDIPAIICGGGSSIEKDIDILKNLETKALIFAGGSALNVLSTHQIRPHLAVGIDPTTIHLSKLAHQSCFEVPFFYNDRIHHEGLRIIQGQRVYLGTKAEGKFFSIESWFDRLFGFEEFMPAMGFSVATVSISLAHYMGCRPIILSGVDLAHTREKGYAEGMEENPLYRHLSSGKGEGTKSFQTIDKKKTYSQFIKERDWLIKFAKKYADCPFYRTSEEGLSLPEYHLFQLDSLQKNYGDLRGILHDKLYKNAPEKISAKQVESALEQWFGSIDRIIDICRRVEKTLKVNLPLAQQEMDLIQGEPAYKHWLYPTDQVLELTLEQHHRFWRRDNMDDERQKSDLATRALTLKRRAYTWQSLKSKFRAIEQKKDIFSNSVEKEELYKTEMQKGCKEGKALRYYPSGKIYAEENYRNGMLEGEQRYYSEGGELVTRLNFDRGTLEGKAELFYSDGKRKRTIHFKQGLRKGEDTYWSESGDVLFSLSYRNARPVGLAKAWYENGRERIAIQFSEEGNIEEIKKWTEYGNQIH